MHTTLAQTAPKSALLLIETQNEWMHPNGKLNRAFIQDTQMMQNAIVNIEKAVQYARAHNLTIIHVGLNFKSGYPELGIAEAGLRKAIPNAGTFQENEFGSAFFESVQPLDNEFVISGRTGASGFTGSNLDAYLRNHKIDNLYLAGYATHVCVESTFRDAHERGYTASVLSDATAAFNQTQQNYFLSEIVHHFGKSLTTDEFIHLSFY